MRWHQTPLIPTECMHPLALVAGCMSTEYFMEWVANFYQWQRIMWTLNSGCHMVLNDMYLRPNIYNPA